MACDLAKTAPRNLSLHPGPAVKAAVLALTLRTGAVLGVPPDSVRGRRPVAYKRDRSYIAAFFSKKHQNKEQRKERPQLQRPKAFSPFTTELDPFSCKKPTAC